MRHAALALIVLCLLLAGCAPAADPGRTAASVAATLTALPAPTPYPTYTPFPAATAAPLDELFCEYGFCIGHPAGVPLYDANTGESMRSEGRPIPGGVAGGKLNGYSPALDLFLLVVWQQGALSEQDMLETIALSMGDTLTGSMDVRIAGPYNLFTRSLDPLPQSALRAGLAAAWRCGERVFGWKAYTDNPARLPGLLDQALRGFRCE